MEYKSNRNVVYSWTCHVVWCPQVPACGVDGRLKKILREVVSERRAEIIEMEIMPDHGPRRVEVDPQYGIHRLVRQMKGRSSGLLRQEFARLRSRLPTLRTNPYFLSTVGGAPLSVITQYIENQ